MVNVCIITTVHPVFDVRIFHKEAAALAKAGYKVCLIAPHDKEEIVKGIKIFPIPKSPKRLTRMVTKNWRAFLLAKNQKADIYHFHDPEFIPWAVLLSWMTSAKIVYDVHEDYSQQILHKHWIPAFLRIPLAALFGRMEKTCSKFFDLLIFATKTIANGFSEFRSVVINNYFSFELLPKKILIQEKPSDTINLIYVGSISETRGIYQMIEALPLIKSRKKIRLKIIGRFHPDDLYQRIQSLPGYHQVEYFNWMPPQQVYQHLFSSDIGLVCLHPIPRYQESQPVKMFEYMAAGLPVIASDFPLWRQILTRKECGILVDPLSPEEIAQAIQTLIDDPARMNTLGENGRKAVKEEYNWISEEEKLLFHYQLLMRK